MDPAIDYYEHAVVSCDIVDHSATDEADQVARIREINRIVADVIHSCSTSDIVWSSGGDGGHVVFRQGSWQQPAIQLILNLYRWSNSESVPLRIAGHYGKVTYIRGADRRDQPIGSGINYAGWLLTQNTWKGIVVSDDFRAEIKAANVDLAVDFHDPQFIPNVNFDPHLLFLMSRNDMRSSWCNSEPGDRAALDLALQEEDGGWDIIYFAKRIWQVNSKDQKAASALENVKPDRLRYRDARGTAEEVNPFFGYLRPAELKDVLRLGQLIERRRGDVICRYGETGDTMFVILRGKVGVYNSEGTGFNEAAEPKHVLRQGEIVGELAYALSRDRTADLIALSDVALLSFNYEDIKSRLPDTRIGHGVADRVSDYINYRVLQHASDNAPYLLGRARKGPLAVGVDRWDYALTILRQHCELIVVDQGELDLTLDRLPTQGFERGGLYILAAGALREQDSDSVLLQGADFPVLWVEVPKLLTFQRKKTYHVEEEEVKILHIAAEGIDELKAPQRKALREALPRAMNRQTDGYKFQTDGYKFDVYLCHSKRDSTVVRQIYQRMADAGIKCWFDEKQIHPGASVTRSIEEGLRSSRFLLACISENFAESDWSRQELDAVVHLDVKRRNESVLVLMINEEVDKDKAIPLLIRNVRRLYYTKDHEFDDLIEYILSARDE